MLLDTDFLIDVWQAGIAMEHDLALVTGNVRHFARVAVLRVLSHRPVV